MVLFLTLYFFPVTLVFSAQNCFSLPDENITKFSKQEIDLKLINQQKFFEKTQAKNRTTCLITIDQLKKIPASRVLVDVRPTSQAKINPLSNINSVNIPLHMIEHKQFLKNKPVIFVPIGAELRQLLITCAKLRQKGFKQTYVLKDGAQALQKNSKNRIISAAKLGLISSKQLFVERFDRDWKIVYVGGGEPGRISQYFTVTKSRKKNNLTKTVKKTVAGKNTTNKPQGVLIFDKDGANFANIRKQFKSANQPVVYYLEGGADSFNDFVHKQYLQTAKSEFVLQKPQRCK